MQFYSPQSIDLSPSQLEAYQFLQGWIEDTPFLHLSDAGGLGKTTILKKLQQETNAHWLDVRPFVAQVASNHPMAIEDSAWQVLLAAVEQHSQIIVDDFQLLFEYASGCSNSPRGSYFESPMKAIRLAAESKGCRLILGSNGNLPSAFENSVWSTSISHFTVDDYRFLFEAMLKRSFAKFDMDSVYRFAPNLNCWRIAHLCHWMKRHPEIETKELLDFIQSQGMASNFEVDEVQEVELSDLYGVDEVVTSLEDNIIMPLENLKLAAELSLAPKRGVMLAGPPGTGKTTIGRALARRLRGKFFLIDGTVISGTEYFYHRIDSTFRMAIANAPSVVFIDDSDVIFESGREHGLYRYLLTMLDGLESKSASNVCVIMTAMDLGNIPPALVRSGRIELWLEMKLPDANHRKRLIEKGLPSSLPINNEENWSKLLLATDGFSGADLKRLVQDAKLRMAVDIHRGRTVRAIDDYAIESAATIFQAQEEYAKSAQRAMEANPNRPRWFNIHPELLGSTVSVVPSV